MPWVPVANFDGEHGAIADLPPQAIPPNIFTSVNNVRFTEGELKKCNGFRNQYGTPAIAPYYLQTQKDNNGTIRTFLPGVGKIYQLSSGAYSDVTRTTGGDYTAGVNNEWTGTVLHGVSILNNGTDVPQSWDAGTSKFINLPNWPAGYKAKTIRSINNFLVAFDIDKSGTRYPHNILWSHPADPGSVPSSWNTADATKDAGESPVSRTPGFLIDGLAMGNQFVLYKETATHIMQYVGLNWVFKLDQGSLMTGLMARGCVAEYKNKHILLSTDDVVLFDGRNYQSLIERKWRRELFNALSGEDYQKCFVVTMPHLKEYWICIPTTLGYPPDVAYVWKPDTNSWSKRELPFVQSITYDFPPGVVGETWNADSGQWDADTSEWSSFEQLGRIALAASPTNGVIYTVNTDNTIDGKLMTAFATHESYPFPDSQVKDSAVRIKQLSKIRPRFKAVAGTQIKISVGWQMEISDPITWEAEQIFTVGTDLETCWAVNGRYLSWKILSDTDCAWSMEGLDFLINYGGYY